MEVIDGENKKKEIVAKTRYYCKIKYSITGHFSAKRQSACINFQDFEAFLATSLSCQQKRYSKYRTLPLLLLSLF